ncbi:MAG: hypothetical protein QW369_01935 [Desulfurococcaceae archaeon]
MDFEQLRTMILLIFMISLAIVIACSIKRLKLNPLISKILILLLFITNFIYKSFYRDPVAALFAWFSAVMAVSTIFDVLLLLGKSLNEKLSVGIVLAVISCGGALANAYVLSTPIGFGVKAFSLAVFTAIHIPLLVALIAYFKGRSDYSKKLVKEWYLT